LISLRQYSFALDKDLSFLLFPILHLANHISVEVWGILYESYNSAGSAIQHYTHIERKDDLNLLVHENKVWRYHL